MKLAMLPPTLFVYFLMMRPSASVRTPYSDGSGPLVGTVTTQRRHFPILSHLKESNKGQEPNGGGGTNQLKLKIETNALDSVSTKEEDEEGEMEDFEDSELFDFPQFTKRQYDDYGHLRFGKRNPTFDDYGHLRFGKRSSSNLLDDYGHLRFGKRNNNNGGGGGGSTDEDYGHLRFGRQAA